MWPLAPDISTDATFAVSAPYEDENSTDVTDPWEDVADRCFLRGESLANAAVVTRTGTVSTAAGSHVSSTSLLAVRRGRAESGTKSARDNAEAVAEAAKKTEDRSLAVRQGAARRVKALAGRLEERTTAESRKIAAARVRATEVASRAAVRAVVDDGVRKTKEATEESRLLALAGGRASVRLNARPLRVRVAISRQRVCN